MARNHIWMRKPDGTRCKFAISSNEELEVDDDEKTGGGGGGGEDGQGWTGGSYDAGTGIVTFTSDDGLGFATGDLRGAAGADGATGPQGPQGDQGIQGLPGADGADGATGAQGPQGDQGPQGIQGIQGPAGNDGADGATGPAGADGADGQGVPVGGTAGQVLEKIDGTDYNTQWATPSGGGSSGLLSVAKAFTSSAGTSLDDVEAAIGWNATTFNTGSDVSVSGSTWTIANAGTYEFGMWLMCDNGNRTELQIRTYLNGVEQTAERVGNYVSRDADQDLGGIYKNYVAQLSASDTVQFRGFGDTDGTCVVQANGTYVVVKRLL